MFTKFSAQKLKYLFVPGANRSHVLVPGRKKQMANNILLKIKPEKFSDFIGARRLKQSTDLHPADMHHARTFRLPSLVIRRKL